MESAVPSLHRDRQLGVLELLREGLAAIGLKKIPQRYVHSLADGFNGEVDISKPFSHASLPFGNPIKLLASHDYRVCDTHRKI